MCMFSVKQLAKLQCGMSMGMIYTFNKTSPSLFIHKLWKIGGGSFVNGVVCPVKIGGSKKIGGSFVKGVVCKEKIEGSKK